MARRIGLATVVSGLLSSAAVARDQPAGTEDFSQYPTDKLLAIVDAISLNKHDTMCEVEVPVTEEVARRFPEDTAALRRVFATKMMCAVREQRFADALAYHEQAETLTGMRGVEGYAFMLAIYSNDGEASLRRLRLAVERPGSANALNSIPGEIMRIGFGLMRKAGLNDKLGEVALELFESPEFGQLNADLKDTFAIWSFLPAVQAGRSELYEPILGFIFYPEVYRSYLADRRFQDAWPAIERRVGPNFTGVMDRYAEWARIEYVENPEDPEKFKQYARALYFDGRFEEAVDLVSAWHSDPAVFDTIDEDHAWAVNLEAYALDALGRLEEADHLFDRLAETSRDNYWLVNFVINRASRLVGQGRWQEGLAANVLADEIAEAKGSTYAKMLVAQNRVCALHNMGRGGDAAADVAFLVENADSSPSVAVGGLLCARAEKQAVDLLLAQLGNEDLRDRVIDGIWPNEFEYFYTASILPDPYDLLRHHPDLLAEFEKYARIIPSEFYAAAVLRRVPLKQD